MVVFLGDGHAAAESEGFGSDLQANGHLFSFVLCTIDASHNPSNQLCFIASLVNDLLHGEVVFDIGAENRIKHFIRRQRIGIFLIGTQFGAGRL